MTQERIPAHTIQFGRIKALIWRNEHEQNGVWYSVVISRLYRNLQGEERAASSFGKDDLLVVSEVSRQAFLWVVEQNGEGQ